jgi:NAD(P)-dependent dehydrogenase (short-subunit alcohol dehydrogenase family)
VIALFEPIDTSANGAPRPDARGLFDLSGRVAVVTGSTRGLGLAIARAFASAGADLVIASRKQPACNAVAAELEAAGRRALACACHVGRWADVDRLVDVAYEAFGRVDVLVNNAGIAPVYPSLGAVTEELFDKTIGVNLKGPFRLSALIGERMVAGEGGSIINVSSTGAVRPTADIVPYAATKAGLNAMTVGFADALGPKVRVNAIMPGPFLTSIARDWDADVLAQRTRTFPLRRTGVVEEIAGAALYLASAASSYTTGAILTVDGGARWAMPGGGDAS